MLRYTQNDSNFRSQALNQPVRTTESIVARRSDLAHSTPGMPGKRPGHPHFGGPEDFRVPATACCVQAAHCSGRSRWETPAAIWASMVLGKQLSS